MILAIILSMALCFMLLALYSAARVSGIESRKEERQSKKGKKTKLRDKRYVIEKFSEEEIDLANSSPEKMREFTITLADRIRCTEHCYHCRFRLAKYYKKGRHYYYVYEQYNIGERNE